MAQLGFYFDMTACSKCKTCQIACKDKNDLKLGALFRRVTSFEGGKFPSPWIYNLSIACNHCEKPKCVENCPSGALHKRADGIVMYDLDKCIGCRMCTWSCPYGAPQYIEELGKVRKCDLCADLIDKGQNPACVDACLMRVLKYGDIEELKKEYGGTSDIKGLPDSSITHPSFIIKPKREAKR
ncbi:DMSO/selenate family reductase complex B subunit [Desulfosporosinus meridiei]|uniref:DMSO reductase, iron-sulfur subunit n=1 Tax=Desulfosporosinus meridiei (strain ATCC BAA-275 / DSM 13257 / KCTC 12902 / NCIMB 13706 / S10) TaxID=768704 RepID=J7J3T1_DESMD|nr:DMSO/selenate family reductase complex B subunit [Desulfosporosinus meridiei]AFQ45928.1 DMSO reductase, iron-sulfur subunit [Desulfosporosinus meridiei DSM 13257]